MAAYYTEGSSLSAVCPSGCASRLDFGISEEKLRRERQVTTQKVTVSYSSNLHFGGGVQSLF